MTVQWDRKTKLEAIWVVEEGYGYGVRRKRSTDFFEDEVAHHLRYVYLTPDNQTQAQLDAIHGKNYWTTSNYRLFLRNVRVLLKKVSP